MDMDNARMGSQEVPANAERVDEEADLKHAGYVSVDLKGRPADMSKTGTWKAAPFIYALLIGNIIGFFGIAANLIPYWVEELHQPISESAIFVTNVFGTNFMSTVGWGFLSDAYIGKFWCSSAGAMLGVTGSIIVAVMVSIKSLRAPVCAPGPTAHCQPASSKLLTPLRFGIYLVAAACGGTNAGLIGLGADQFEEEIPREKLQESRFFNAFYFCFALATLATVTLIAYLIDVHSQGLGWGVCAGAFLLGLILFWVGIPSYRHKLSSGNAVRRIAEVLISAGRKWRIPDPVSTADLYELHHFQGSSIQGSRKIKHTDTLKFLDKAAIIIPDREKVTQVSENSASWYLCTVTQVEETKRILHMLPCWSTIILIYIPFVQVQTFSVQQVFNMDRHMGSLNLPPAATGAVPSLIVIASIPIYDLLIVPTIRRFTGLHRGITPLQRIGIGFTLAIIGMIIASAVEEKRVAAIEKYVTDNNLRWLPRNAIVPIAHYWIYPQYILIGFTEMFAIVGQNEFFYNEAPDSMRSIAQALNYACTGIGTLLSGVLINVVNNVTRNRKGGSWLIEQVDSGGIAKFYRLLAILTAINLCFFIICAFRYEYRGEVDRKNRRVEYGGTEQDSSA